MDQIFNLLKLFAEFQAEQQADLKNSDFKLMQEMLHNTQEMLYNRKC